MMISAQVSINGVNSGPPVTFAATGSWTEWGKTFTQVQLITGINTVTLTATTNSGPNLDYIEVFPAGVSQNDECCIIKRGIGIKNEELCI